MRSDKHIMCAHIAIIHVYFLAKYIAIMHNVYMISNLTLIKFSVCTHSHLIVMYTE